MTFKKIYFLLLLLLAGVSLHSQKVETLVTDMSKDFEAIHWGEDGRIYCTDYTQGKVYTINLDGTAETVVSGLSATAGGGFGNDGTFYFAAINQGKMMRLNDDNSYTEVGSGYNQPVAMLADKSDDDIFYVSEYGNNRLSRLDISTGESTLVVNNQGINGPDALIYDWDGKILIANFNNHRIHRINDDNTTSLFAAIPAGGFMGYIILAGDYVYVPSITTRRIYRIDRDGNIEHIAGSGGTGDADGVGLNASFRGPNGICASPSGDTLLIADDNRIRMVTNFNVTGVKQQILNLDNFVGFPNPVVDSMQMTFGLKQKSKLTYQIIGFEGNYISEKVILHAESGRSQFDVDCSNLVTGLYFVKIMDVNGKVFTHNFYKT